MTRFPSWLVLCKCLCGLCCLGELRAQNIPTTLPAVPEITSTGTVVFRHRAPQAKEVKAVGQFGEAVMMKKGENGIWTGTTAAAVKTGIYEYFFMVDGMQVIDAMNSMIKPQRSPSSSILHIAATPPAPWDLQAIPHGTLHTHGYQAKALNGAYRELVVYTPPNYVAGSKKWPVMYLSHGFSDNEKSWSVHGKAHWIFDDLIAKGKAKPMIVVMPDAHAVPVPLPPGKYDKYSSENSPAFRREMLEDIIPLIDANYSTSAQRQDRAFAGLSMGGHHALMLGLLEHRSFGAIGSFSAAPPDAKDVQVALDQSDAVNTDLSLLWIACGKNDFLYQRNVQFEKIIEKAGIKHTFQTTEGDHSWPVWRRYLVEFAPLLFN